MQAQSSRRWPTAAIATTIVLSLLLTVAGTAGAFGVLTIGSLRDTTNDLEQQIDESDQLINDLEQQVDESDRRISYLEEQLAAAVFGLDVLGRGGVFSMPVGTCFDDQADGHISSVPEIDCSQPHDNEVFALIDYTETDIYPGTNQMSTISEGLCRAQFQGYVGIDYESSVLDVFPIYPTEESWTEDDDREIICALYESDLDKLTGSMRGAAR